MRFTQVMGWLHLPTRAHVCTRFHNSESNQRIVLESGLSISRILRYVLILSEFSGLLEFLCVIHSSYLNAYVAIHFRGTAHGCCINFASRSKTPPFLFVTAFAALSLSCHFQLLNRSVCRYFRRVNNASLPQQPSLRGCGGGVVVFHQRWPPV